MFWMVETAPFDGGHPTSLHAGLHASKDPILVSMLVLCARRRKAYKIENLIIIIIIIIIIITNKEKRRGVKFGCFGVFLREEKKGKSEL